MRPDGSFCLSSGKLFELVWSCSSNYCYTSKIILDKNSGCIPCPRTYTEDGRRPSKETFDKYILFFLNDVAFEDCSKAGLAAYSEAITYIYDDDGDIHIRDSHFMSYHTASVGSKGFYSSLRQAHKIADDVKKMLAENGYGDVVFFPYR